jgi:hypothetical protein
MSVNTRPDLLKDKGRMWVFDEKAAVKDWIELTLVDNVKANNPTNPTEIKSPSGITVWKSLDLDFVLACDWYHPGDLAKLELLYRGVVDLDGYDGATVQSEAVAVSFAAAGDAFPLPGFNGAKTAVTITHVKSVDGVTTYTVTDDYTVAVDSVTGLSMLVHVSGGDIPLNTDVIVTYGYTPSAGQVLKPNYSGAVVFRHVVVDAYPDPDDLTKMRRYYMPNCTIESEMGHSLLEIGQDNTSPNVLPITFKHAKPDAGSKAPKWYYADFYNVPAALLA